MFEFLEGFHKRMQLIAVVDALINRRKKKQEIEDTIGDRPFENLIFSVLVFIMEKTLTEDEECTLRNISFFVRDLLNNYYDDPSSEDKSLEVTEYIVKTILQFDGVATYYPVMNYELGKWEDLRVKIIDEKVMETPKGYKSIYSLTDQGYDFLFRTKEVDNELSFSVEEFKLRELIKRKNYKKALNQSNSLVQMVRQKKRDLEQYILSAKENIYGVDISKFDELIDSTFKLLSDEYEILGEIQNTVKISEMRLRDEYNISGKLMDEMKKAQQELYQISRNLTVARQEQSELINKREGSYKILISTIEDTFRYVLEKRYDFEKEILKKMELAEAEDVENLWKLFNPLFHVVPFRNFNLGLAYRAQGLMKEASDEEEPGFFMDELTEDLENIRAEKVNKTYLSILDSMAKAAVKEGDATTFKTYCEAVMDDEMKWKEITEENLLFTSMLKLYEIEHIDIKAWRESGENILINQTDEFNMDYLLYRLEEESEIYRELDGISFTKIPGDSIKLRTPWSKEIEIDNIMIKVVKKNG